MTLPSSDPIICLSFAYSFVPPSQRDLEVGNETQAGGQFGGRAIQIFHLDLRRSFTIRMNYRYLSAAVAAGVLSAVFTTASFAQSAGPAAPAATTAQAAPTAQPVPPVNAIPAKIAIVAFQQVVMYSNEGQRAVQDVEKRYEPTRTKLQALNDEIEGLKKKLQSGTALPEDQRSALVKDIDSKDKQLQREGEDFKTGYQQDADDALKKVASKIFVVLDKFAKEKGFTMVLDVSDQQQGTILWAVPETNISAALLEEYNKQSGVAAPVPAAPSAGRPATHSTTTHTAPKQ